MIIRFTSAARVACMSGVFSVLSARHALRVRRFAIFSIPGLIGRAGASDARCLLLST